MVFYEAPHRIETSLEALLEGIGDRRIALCRELTKRYEEVVRGTISEILERIKVNPLKGEMVVVVEGLDLSLQKQEKRQNFLEMDLMAHMALYEAEGLSQKDAMKRVAKDWGVSKSDIYKALLQTEE